MTKTLPNKLEEVRRPRPGHAPEWVNAIPSRLGKLIRERHWQPQHGLWGLAGTDPQTPYGEVVTLLILGVLSQYDLYDAVGGQPTEEQRKRALQFWQSWQDQQTGRFKDARDPARLVNEKYVVGIIHSLGGEPLYAHTITSDTGCIETEVFLQRCKNDPDWQNGGWGVGSGTGAMAVEILREINKNDRTNLIPALEQGLQLMLEHQGPDGLWGPTTALVQRRIGGTLKVIGRLYFQLGMRVPRTEALADALIRHQRNGDWMNQHTQSECVPRNVAEMIAYCLEASDYRREDLLRTLEEIADIGLREWTSPDGVTLLRRGDPNSPGINGPIMYGLGICGAYLHWEDCRLPNPLADMRRGTGLRYRPVLQTDNLVKIIDTVPGGSIHAGHV